MTQEIERLSSLLAYVQADGRVCPQPSRWNDLWELLPDKKRLEGGWDPPLPLILGAWHFASGLERSLRLRQHIEYAARHGALDTVDMYLRSLATEDWYWVGD